jgi:peptide/nickel transport system permease protein
MIRFILRRLLSTALVLLVVTFVLYLLLNVALDFFWDLRASTSPNIEALYESRRRLLDLDTPADRPLLQVAGRRRRLRHRPM